MLEQQLHIKYVLVLLSGLLLQGVLVSAKVENTLYIGSISLVVISPVISPWQWMFSRVTGEMKTLPLFFSNTPDTAFSFVPAVTYYPKNDSPTVAFICHHSVWQVCYQVAQLYRCRFSYTHSRQVSLSIYVGADHPA